MLKHLAIINAVLNQSSKLFILSFDPDKGKLQWYKSNTVKLRLNDA